MIEISKKYRTFSGLEVRVYAVDGGGDYCIHGAYHDGNGWFPQWWRKEGQYGPGNGEPIEMDLIEVKPSAIEEMIAWLEKMVHKAETHGYTKEGVQCTDCYIALTEARRIRDSNATSDE